MPWLSRAENLPYSFYPVPCAMSQSVSPWPKERYGGPVWPRFEEVQELLERWQREHPALMELQIRARSEQDRPVYVAILTDSTVSADDKEHVLVSALHAGVERNAAMTVLYLMEWLFARWRERLRQDHHRPLYLARHRAVCRTDQL